MPIWLLRSSDADPRDRAGATESTSEVNSDWRISLDFSVHQAAGWLARRIVSLDDALVALRSTRSVRGVIHDHNGPKRRDAERSYDPESRSLGGKEARNPLVLEVSIM